MRRIAPIRFIQSLYAHLRRAPQRPSRLCSLRVLGLILLLGGTSLPRIAAQPAPTPYPISIGAALADIDGDFIPDQAGDTVMVAGRALVASGVLRKDRLDVAIEDQSGGLRLVALHIGKPIAPGDSIVAMGILEHIAGQARLAVSAYRVVPVQPAPREPVPLPLSKINLELYEGRLARIKGYVAGKGRVRSGTYLNVVSGDSAIVAFIYASNGANATFDEVHVSDYVSITGIIGQRDQVKPYNTSYQIYPRLPRDVRMAGLPPRYYRNLVAGVILVLLAVLTWAYTLRREVQRRIAESDASETRYQTLFHHAADALFVHDLRQGISSPVLEVNKVACEVFGYPPEAFATLTLGMLAAPDTHDTLTAHLAALHSGKQVVGELPLMTRDGHTIPFEVSSHVFTMDNRPIVLSIARDMTRRKAYEQDLINAKQEAETVAHLKASFLANMSHEIRTPLTTIIGFADMLAEDTEGDSRDLAERILNSGQRLMDTINSILHLSRLDAEEVSLHPEVIDLVEEVRGTTHLLDPLVEQKDLHLRFEAQQPAIPAFLDRTCLHRIINNLVGNAIKFTEAGEVVVSVSARDGRFCLTVRDTGIGITPTFLPYLFDEFKQESTGISRSHYGSGLGLAITRRLVEKMGGDIHVQSEKGQGTTFTVTAPLHAPAPRLATTDDATRPPSRPASSLPAKLPEPKA